MKISIVCLIPCIMSTFFLCTPVLAIDSECTSYALVKVGRSNGEYYSCTIYQRHIGQPSGHSDDVVQFYAPGSVFQDGTPVPIDQQMTLRECNNFLGDHGLDDMFCNPTGLSQAMMCCTNSAHVHYQDNNANVTCPQIQ